jgi:hypothetical protein
MDHSLDEPSVDSGYHKDQIARKITPLRLIENPQRAELIVDVVEAFTRLLGSVTRFVEMLARGGKVESVGTAKPQRLSTLLSSLERHAGKAKFRRLQELNRVIERAQLAEAHRDVIFQSPVADEADLRKAAAELVQIDIAFISLCVVHVLDRHARARG